MSESVFFGALALVCGTVAFIASLQFLRRYFELKQERSLRTPPDELTDRLDRIGVAVEATALEVERISEAKNRFIAKLLADGSKPANPSTKPERVITPH